LCGLLSEDHGSQLACQPKLLPTSSQLAAFITNDIDSLGEAKADIVHLDKKQFGQLISLRSSNGKDTGLRQTDAQLQSRKTVR